MCLRINHRIAYSLVVYLKLSSMVTRLASRPPQPLVAKLMGSTTMTTGAYWQTAYDLFTMPRKRDVVAWRTNNVRIVSRVNTFRARIAMLMRVSDYVCWITFERQKRKIKCKDLVELDIKSNYKIGYPRRGNRKEWP